VLLFNLNLPEGITYEIRKRIARIRVNKQTCVYKFRVYIRTSREPESGLSFGFRHAIRRRRRLNAGKIRAPHEARAQGSNADLSAFERRERDNIAPRNAGFMSFAFLLSELFPSRQSDHRYVPERTTTPFGAHGSHRQASRPRCHSIKTDLSRLCHVVTSSVPGCI